MPDERAPTGLHGRCRRTGRTREYHGFASSDYCPDRDACSANWNPVIGFTPEASPRDANGVPLPNAAGARNVVVTYTPVPPGGPAPKSGNAMVSVGDNYFHPDELHVTLGTTIEWRYDGGGGETESTHNVIALDNSFSSGDLNAGTRWSFAFLKPGEFAYVCSYHATQMTGKIVVQMQ